MPEFYWYSCSVFLLNKGHVNPRIPWMPIVETELAFPHIEVKPIIIHARHAFYSYFFWTSIFLFPGN